ncbi:hypothetical protein AK812_SmicGene23908 [Symbiodinium microadriaticum]|uniref:Uncharacterized protein n=1 Tax=Symbiodinium microadriaticum TaxID=2951 RepID=A0A1Q9DG31_SYMMI|nr:hypothetical protein AK812_SmicGene23908 [Symbiodinium microadriaticum]
MMRTTKNGVDVKVVKAELRMPKAAWVEWKQHRLRLWRASKVWAGEDKDDDEKKDDKEKKEPISEKDICACRRGLNLPLGQRSQAPTIEGVTVQAQ